MGHPARKFHSQPQYNGIMEKLMQRISGRGKLVFDDGLAAIVNHCAEEESPGKWRGQVLHAEGHPDWHPIVSLHTMPFTLVTSAGLNLRVFLESEKGFFHGTPDLLSSTPDE